MSKWKWQALAKIARVSVYGGHPIVGAILIAALALTPVWITIALWLLR